MGEPLSDEELVALAQQRQSEQVAEYGRFVAAQDIHHDGALAYVAGQPVPVSNVKLHGYLQDGLVITVEQAAKAREDAAKAVSDAAAAEAAQRDADYEAALKAAQIEAPPPGDQPEPTEAEPLDGAVLSSENEEG